MVGYFVVAIVVFQPHFRLCFGAGSSRLDLRFALGLTDGPARVVRSGIVEHVVRDFALILVIASIHSKTGRCGRRRDRRLLRCRLLPLLLRLPSWSHHALTRFVSERHAARRPAAIRGPDPMRVALVAVEPVVGIARRDALA